MIGEPGFYRLASDVRDTTAPVWLDIRASGVVLDGMGHTIDGIDADGSVGIRVLGDGALAKIVIQNVTVTDFAYGIALYDVDSGQIIYVQAASNTYDGIMVVGGSGIEIHCSLVDRDDDGINISATRGAVVANSVVTGNVRGSGVHLSHGCDGVTVLGNLIGENDEGIEVESTTNSVIQSNRIHASRYYGLNLTSARDLTVVDNHFNNSVNIRYPTGAFSGIWNLEAQPGPNVLGNSFVGGNYWGTPDGTGFSDTTPDLDGDGFVNGMYVLGAIGTDRLPLGPPLSAAGGAVVAPPVAHGSAVPFAGSDSDPAGSPGAGTPAAPDMAGTTGAAGAGVVTTMAQATGTPPTATTPAGSGTAGQAAAATAATVPGFGAVVALAGLGGATLVALRRR